jgi:hypothetical protein
MWKRVIKVLVFAAVLAAIMQAIRLLIIEPDEMAALCEVSKPWSCQLRDLAVQGFARHLYGPISIAAAVLAWLTGIRALAVLAMLSGMAGAVLYDFELSAAGLLLGALLLARGRNVEAAGSSAPVIE